jgi:hypothetical protein
VSAGRLYCSSHPPFSHPTTYSSLPEGHLLLATWRRRLTVAVAAVLLAARSSFPASNRHRTAVAVSAR